MDFHGCILTKALTALCVFSLASPQHPHLAWLSVSSAFAVFPLTHLPETFFISIYYATECIQR